MTKPTGRREAETLHRRHIGQAPLLFREAREEAQEEVLDAVPDESLSPYEAAEAIELSLSFLEKRSAGIDQQRGAPPIHLRLDVDQAIAQLDGEAVFADTHGRKRLLSGSLPREARKGEESDERN